MSICNAYKSKQIGYNFVCFDWFTSFSSLTLLNQVIA